MEANLYQGNFDQALALVEPEIEKIKQLRNKIHSVNLQSKMYRIALAYFGANQLKKALWWINQILNFDEMKYRRDVQSSVLILNLLIHYELKNYGLLESRIPTTIAQLKKLGRWLAPEKLLIQALRDTAFNGKKHATVFKQLKVDFNTCINQNPLDEYFIAYLNFDSWVDRKLKA